MSTQISVYKGDITKLEVDAIVNAANKTLLGGGGVDGAIHRAAGIKLGLACLKLHGCNVGEAKITDGFKLKAKHIIHTVGPQYRGRQEDAALLAACYKNSLNLAKEHEAHSIAFSCISTGIYGYPTEEAAKVAISAVTEWIDTNNDYNIEVVFCCFNDRDEQFYIRLLTERN